MTEIIEEPGDAVISTGSGRVLLSTKGKLKNIKGDVENGESRNIEEFGGKVDGKTDNTEAIQKAIDSLPTSSSHGGKVVIGPGLCIAKTASLKGLTNVTLQGAGGLDAFDINGPPLGGTVILSDGDSSEIETIIDVRNSKGCALRDIQAYSLNSGFSGAICDAEGAWGFQTNRVTLAVGGEVPLGEPTCLYLGPGAFSCSFYSTKFSQGAYGVVGRVSDVETNAHSFYGCAFYSNQYRHVLNAGKGWSFFGCTSEQLRNKHGEEIGVGFYAQQEGLFTEGLGLYGCWIGDGAKLIGNQIEYQGSGLTIHGGELAIGEAMVKIVGETHGINILGVNIEAASAALYLNAPAYDVVFLGNHIAPSVTTPIINPSLAKGSSVLQGYDLLDSGWISPVLENSWVVKIGEPAYRKQGDVVRLRGTLGEGNSETVAFTLPVEFRPTEEFYASVPCGGLSQGYILISPSGAVTLAYPGEKSASLDGITFTTN